MNRQLQLLGFALFLAACGGDGKEKKSPNDDPNNEVEIDMGGEDARSEDEDAGSEDSGSEADMSRENRPPSVPSVVITPEEPDATDTLECDVETMPADPDGDPVELIYTWYKGELLVTNGRTLTGLSKGDTLRCEVVASDGELTSEPGSAEVIIQNAPPSMPTVQLSPSTPTTTDDLNCLVTVASTDVDGDAITYRYEWLRDGALTSLADVTLSATNTASGETWTCRAIPNDGETDGPAGAASSEILNTPPSIASAAVSPSAPTTTSDLDCQITTPATDVDGDTIDYAYQWIRDGTATGLTGASLEASNTSKGESWACRVTPNDGTDDGAESTSSTVTVVNTPPSVSSVTLAPSSPTTEDDLLCMPIDSADDDGDSLDFTYRWFKSGADSGFTGATLPSSATSKSEFWSCEVVANDGTANSSATSSSALTILNSAPVLSSVELLPSMATVSDTLTCSPTASDADGDAISYTYAWLVNGSDTGATTSTLSAATFAKEDSVLCTVTADDGTATDSLDSSPAAIVNSPPTGASVEISPHPATQLDDLTCVASGSTDPDGDSISYSYAWLVDGNATGNTTPTVSASDTSIGEVWTCEVAPYDGTATGPPNSEATTIHIACETGDMFEDNDTAAEAASVVPGSYSLLVCGDPVDDDWFTTDVNVGDTLDIDLLFSQTTGNVDLILFNDRSLSTPVATSQTNTDNESIRYRSSRDQTLTWRVLTTSPTPAIPYDMDVSVTSGGACADDNFSPNHSSAAAAAIEAPATNREGLYAALTKCEDTEDWFEVDLVGGTDFEAYINFDHGDADLNLTVYDPSNTPIGTGGSSMTDNESVEFEVPTTGTYTIQIESAERARVLYDLMIYVDSIGPEDRECPDPYENNDVRPDAASIGVGTFDDLLLCWEGGQGNDQDFYRIFVPEDAELTVDLLFSHDEGDINALLYRGSDLSPVSSGTSTTDNEQVTSVNNGAGENYILRVFGAVSPFTSRYDLEILLEFQSSCADDTLGAPTFADASGAMALTSGAYDALTLCEDTEDWFKLPPSTTSVEAHVELNQLRGDVDIQLVDSNEFVVAESSDSSNVVTIDEAGLSSTETYYLRVLPRNGISIRNDYDLWLSVNGQSVAAPLCADPYERNDDRQAAATLDFSTQPVYADMIACGEDDDWYQLSNLQSSAPGYRVEVFFDHVDNESDLAIDFFDANGNPAAGTGVSVDTQTNDEYTVFSPNTAGTYLMKISNAAGSTTETPYFMWVDRDRNTNCPEDGYEPNDGFVGNEMNAPDLATIPGTYPLGSCSGGPNDYFSFEVPANGDYTVEILYNEGRLDLNGSLYFEVEVGGNTIVADSPFTAVDDNRLAGTYMNAEAGERVGIFVKNEGTTYGFYVLRITVN